MNALSTQRLLVVGGNGFLGSAVCRAAISRGWQVDSLSTSGRAPLLPDGQQAPWTHKVTYHQGSAMDPSTFAHLLPSTTAVVHTLGILLEADYKGVVRQGSLGGILRSLVGGQAFLGDNPLERRGGVASNGRQGQGEEKPTYETMNRDSAVSVLSTLRSTASSTPATTPTPFVYISAEDIFQPLIPARYISTKREAEAHVLSSNQANRDGERRVRGLVLRPGIMTHPTERPFLTPLTPILALSAAVPPVLSALLRKIPHTPTGPIESLATFLRTRTLDVDTVGEAVCLGIEGGAKGVLNVADISALSERRSKL